MNSLNTDMASSELFYVVHLSEQLFSALYDKYSN